jgi:hypothetical protein
MTNTVTYDYSPNQSVYVINMLGPNQEYPYWYNGFGWDGYGWYGSPYYGYGYVGGYPRGFTSTTPAIESGTVLQGRILITASTNSPTIMYDVRLNGAMGTVSFPEDMVFPATAGTAGSQTINYNGTLTPSTPITLASANYTATVYVDGTPTTVTINLSTTDNISVFMGAFNAIMGSQATLTLSAGNLLLTSLTTGVTSNVIIVDAAVNPLFGSLPGYIGAETSVPGVASGLDQAQAAYALLVQNGNG